jgi:hypothetical protein
MFTDWVTAKEWVAGRGPLSKDGSSAMLDLQLLWAYQLAADLETKLGIKESAGIYQARAAQLKKTIQSKYWDASKGMFADRMEKDLFSQHTNSLAILTGTVAPEQLVPLGKKLLSDTNLAPASIYFKYYLHQALVKAGMGNDYLKWLDKWRENIQMGLSTWAETSELNSSRSDCHAWGSSPNIEFFRTLLGIESDGLNFSKVKIQPHLGEIKKVSGSIPHPNGTLAVSYEWVQNKWNVQVELPGKTTGSLMWKGQVLVLKTGVIKFVL